MELQEFKDKLEDLGLNFKEFAEIVNIPYSTVTKYGRSTPIPSWVSAFLDIYTQNVKLESLKKEIKTLAEKL
ncbi:XRE family transcriptional regulator [Sulfurimonas sp.]|jgi:predicted transcriptional regulator|uniref:XRE family transcriptional regulator n=1 Tax=Sulfurimonas sp. TaxID=2022749 RepID=UPI0026198AA1|nr:XRE family transcriptional regulator [Sulfurimonas sp.]MDD3856389.1 XRE family transcriptional regulator [Sulfurimonas sp.]